MKEIWDKPHFRIDTESQFCGQSVRRKNLTVKQESRAIAAKTARCENKFRFIPASASRGFRCDSTGLLLFKPVLVFNFCCFLIDISRVYQVTNVTNGDDMIFDRYHALAR